jgi:hypothetical protein
LTLHELLSAEGEQLASEVGGTVSRRSYLSDAIPRSIGRHGIQQGQFGIAANHGQEIIEVMSHSSGELADSFHFLHLPELLLGCVKRFLRADAIQCAATMVGQCLQNVEAGLIVSLRTVALN